MDLPILFLIVLIAVLIGAISLGEYGDKYIGVPVREEREEDRK